MDMKLKEKTGIYSITNLLNGKRYIGSTYCNFYDRFCAHRSTLNRNKHSSILLQRSWNKHGKDAFKFEIIEICTDKLHKRELHYINKYKTHTPEFGYNISKETNNARLGHQQHVETRLKISKSLKGLKRSKETIKKMSKSKIGKHNPMFGKKQSDDTKRKRFMVACKAIKRCDGKIYFSLKEAARDIGTTPQNVSQSLRKGHKAKGYKFIFVKERER